MKKFIAGLLTGMVLLCLTIITHAQITSSTPKPSFIQPYPLGVTFNKTTNLIFPYAIKSVDRGSRDVLVQKAKGEENILLVKAGKEAFAETNLSVITADGKLYSFLLNYSTNPSVLNISFPKDTAVENNSLASTGNNVAEMERVAEKIAGGKRTVNGVKDKKYGLRFRLNGLYLKSDIFYFQLEVKNASNISYDIDMLRFFIQDEKKLQRTTSQELELLPVYVHGDTTSVKAQSKNVIVIALPKFTAPDKKYLLIELMERNGGRNLHLNVRNRTLIKAQIL